MNKIYEHDEVINPLLQYCQPCMFINLEKFIEEWKKNIMGNNAKMKN